MSHSCRHPLFFIFLLPLPCFLAVCSPPTSVPVTSPASVNLSVLCSHTSFLLLPTAKPKNSAKVLTVQAGSKSVVVAQCEAADGKPAATIKWLSSVGGNHSTSITNGSDGTVTVRSEYRLVPTPADDGREVTCLVDQKTQEQPWVYPVRLSVECKRDTYSHFRAHIPSTEASEVQ